MSRPLSETAESYLRQYDAVDDGTAVVYLSTPITTGPRLLAWLAKQPSGGGLPAHEREAEVVRDEVIAENLARLGPVRERIQSHYPDARLVDPTTLMVPGWKQWEYHRFWVEVLNRCVDRIVFADGWELSTGCTIEYAAGLELGLPMEDSSGSPILPEDAERLLLQAALELQSAHRDDAVALAAAERAARVARQPLKDAQLARLAETYNVASFISFTAHEARLRYQVMPRDKLPRSVGLRRTIEALLAVSRSGSVNVRTFRAGRTKGNPFRYGLTTVDEVLRCVQDFAAAGYYCIVNETIDIHDGGVSGVLLGGVAEFAPDDTPRAVEKGGTARLPSDLAERMFRLVYGEEVSLPADPSARIEFSVHPVRVGQRHEPVLIWEVEPVDPVALEVDVQWPNRFSRLLGDKTYGLLVAEGLGLPVPATTAICRRVAPFRFGRSTGTGEWWMRTAPNAQTPGHFTTTRGWVDPFAVLAEEDPDLSVAAVLAQEGVDALYSGATLPRDGADHIVEGVAGVGDTFMLGGEPSVPLPSDVEHRVRSLLAQTEEALGPGVRIEWAVDGEATWLLQLHRVSGGSESGVLNPGDADEWLPFEPSLGLDVLTELIADARERGAGIEITRPVGLTSHIGDLLRKARIPGRLAVGAGEDGTRGDASVNVN